MRTDIEAAEKLPNPSITAGADAPTLAWAQVHTPYVRWLLRKLQMPVIYGEAGYHSQEHSFATPQKAAGLQDLAAPAAQADAYRALLDVLAQERGVYGVTWWYWEAGASLADTGYSPAGKPAECVLAAHWSQDATVRAAAAGPQCDVHAFDAAVLAAAKLLPAV